MADRGTNARIVRARAMNDSPRMESPEIWFKASKSKVLNPSKTEPWFLLRLLLTILLVL
jgi:hypothetical protein